MTVATPTAPAATPKVKTTADVLRHAALIIEERGHHRGSYVGPDGAVCAWGAINVAVFGEPVVLFGHPVPKAVSALHEYTGDRAVGSWNDCRTAAEVTAALRAAADALERAS